MTRVALIAALPGELKPLVRGWPHSERNGVHFWAQRSKEDGVGRGVDRRLRRHGPGRGNARLRRP